MNETLMKLSVYKCLVNKDRGMNIITRKSITRLRGYKTDFMLNLTEHDNNAAHKC